MVKIQEIQERIRNGEDLAKISSSTGTPLKFLEEIRKQFLKNGSQGVKTNFVNDEDLDEVKVREKAIQRVSSYMNDLDNITDLDQLKEIKLKLDITRLYLNMTKDNTIVEEDSGELAKMFYERNPS